MANTSLCFWIEASVEVVVITTLENQKRATSITSTSLDNWKLAKGKVTNPAKNTWGSIMGADVNTLNHILGTLWEGIQRQTLTEILRVVSLHVSGHNKHVCEIYCLCCDTDLASAPSLSPSTNHGVTVDATKPTVYWLTSSVVRNR